MDRAGKQEIEQRSTGESANACTNVLNRGKIASRTTNAGNGEGGDMERIGKSEPVTVTIADPIIAEASARVQYRVEIRRKALEMIRTHLSRLAIDSRVDALHFLNGVEEDLKSGTPPWVPRSTIDQAFFDLSDEGVLRFDSLERTVAVAVDHEER